MKMKMIVCIMVLSIAAITIGCMNVNKYKWIYPAAGKSYTVDSMHNLTFKLYYATRPKVPNVSLNGEPVTECFTFRLNTATARLSCLLFDIELGENVLQVEPDNYGPKVAFNVE